MDGDSKPLLTNEPPGTTTPTGPYFPRGGILSQIWEATRVVGVSRVDLKHRSHGNDVKPTAYKFVRVDAGELELRVGERPLILYPEQVNRFEFEDSARVLSIWTN